MYLYIVDCNEFTKIGYGVSISDRLSALRTGNPYGITVAGVYVYKNAFFVEQVLHQRFSQSRAHGEWFNLCQEERENLFDLCERLGGELFDLSTLVEQGGYKTVSEEKDDDPENAVEEIIALPYAKILEDKRNKKLQELAESIREKWSPSMSKSAVARLFGTRYAGSWATKVDKIIAILSTPSA